MSRRRRGRITVQSQPTGATRAVRRMAGVVCSSIRQRHSRHRPNDHTGRHECCQNTFFHSALLHLSFPPFFESWIVTVSLSNSYCESIFQLLHTGFFCLCMLTKPLLSPLFLKIYKNHSLNCILCSKAARYSCGWKCFYQYCDSPASSGIFFAVFR